MNTEDIQRGLIEYVQKYFIPKATLKKFVEEKIKKLGAGLSLEESENTEYEKGYYGCAEDIISMIKEYLLTESK